MAVLCAAAALDTRVQHAMGELVLLVTVTRHGSRVNFDQDVLAFIHVCMHEIGDSVASVVGEG